MITFLKLCGTQNVSTFLLYGAANGDISPSETPLWDGDVSDGVMVVSVSRGQGKQGTESK